MEHKVSFRLFLQQISKLLRTPEIFIFFLFRLNYFQTFDVIRINVWKNRCFQKYSEYK